jgi:Zn-dependent metalloprotease
MDRKLFTSALLVSAVTLAACNQGSPAEDSAGQDPVFADEDGAISFESEDPEELRASLGDLAAPLEAQIQLLARRHQLDPLSLRPFRADTDELGMTHIRLQQEVDGIPVWGGEAIVHLQADGALRHQTDELRHAPEVDTSPALERAEAIQIALDQQVDGLPESAEAELVIKREGERDHLCWKVELDLRDLDGAPLSKPVVFVDAHDGEVIFQYDNLHTGYTNTYYNGGQSISTSPTYVLWWISGYEMKESRLYGASAGGAYTNGSLMTDSDDYWTASTQRPGGSAYWAAGRSLDYLYSAHGFWGPNGAGSQLRVVADYGTSYNNAHGAGTTVWFGNGDGSTFSSMTDVDIVAHEVGHCVTDATARLVYSNESGALNESFSDIMAAMTERMVDGGTASTNTWKIGEDSYTPATSGDALRTMSNPTVDGISRDHYSSRYVGTWDSGGVHVNSGIGNLAFYLTAQGGSHPRLGGSWVYGIGPDAAAWIWFRAHRYYMTSTSDFADMRNATALAAADGYGATSWVVSSVDAAWDAVGVAGSGCEVGYLGAAGEQDNLPGGTYYYSAAGVHNGELNPSAGLNAGLYLYQWNGSGWNYVAGAASGSGTQTVAYLGSAGYYIWLAYDHAGVGNYNVCITHP